MAARLRPLITPEAVFAGVAAFVVVLALHAGRGTLFFLDEWRWIADRHDWNAHVFLEPHNEHLSLVPVAIYKLLLAITGLAHYWAYRVVLLVANVGCAWLVFLLVGRRAGAWWGVAGAALLLVLGRSYDNLLWPFQITYLLSIAAGLGALLALDRDDRRGDVMAAVLVGVSIASSGLGLPIAAGVAVELALSRTLRRRWFVLAAPLATYLLWYAAYGQAAPKYWVDEAPWWALRAIAAAFGALVGEGSDWGWPLLAVAVLGAAAWLARHRPTPRLAGVLTTGVAFWLLTGASRAELQPPTTTRYVYLGVVVIVLAAAEMLPRRPASHRWALAAAAVVIASAALNVGPLQDGGSLLRRSAIGLRAELAALEIARPYVPPRLKLGSGLLGANEYLGAFAAFGSSPGLRPGELPAATPLARAAADTILLRAGALRRTAPSGRPGGTCRIITRPTEVVLRRGATLRIRSLAGPTEVRGRRFGPTFYGPPIDAVAAGSALEVRPRADGSSQPWRIGLGPAGRAGVCLG